MGTTKAANDRKPLQQFNWNIIHHAVYIRSSISKPNPKITNRPYKTIIFTISRYWGVI